MYILQEEGTNIILVSISYRLLVKEQRPVILSYDGTSAIEWYEGVHNKLEGYQGVHK